MAVTTTRMPPTGGSGCKVSLESYRFQRSRIEDLLLPVSAILFVTFIALFGILSEWSFLVLLSVPLALRTCGHAGQRQRERASWPTSSSASCSCTWSSASS
jgi:1,4-dihydroxy-2-naphthoate octaprenyltransferase